MQYPVVVGTNAADLNRIIQRWIGASCNESPVLRDTYPSRATYHGAEDCLAALSKACAALQSESGSTLLATGPCQAEISTRVELDTAGLLVIGLYNFGSTEHGFLAVPNAGASMEYLNLDVATGRALGLRDILQPSYPATLERMIARSLRAQAHVANGETLTQAGFLTNNPPIPGTMEILRDGLRFSYRAGEITRESVSPPDVVVSYEVLSSLIPEGSPLRRLLSTSRREPPAATKTLTEHEGIWKWAVPPTRMNGMFDDHDPIGLVAGKLIPADCSFNWTDPDTRKLYCFTSATSLVYFLDAPQTYVAEAQKTWLALKGKGGKAR